MTHPTAPIRVLIVDDQKPARMGLGLMVGRAPDMEVVAAVGDGHEAVDYVATCRERDLPLPHIVLMDIRMPVMNGIDATREITSRFPSVKVLVMTTYDEDDYAFGALDAGATGYLLKDTRTDELHRAIRAVTSGDAVLTPRITAEMVRSRPRRPVAGQQRQAQEAFRALSPREFEVAGLVATGMNNAEIAEHLTIQPDSVKKTVSRILSRMQLRDRTQIVVAWYEAGLA